MSRWTSWTAARSLSRGTRCAVPARSAPTAGQCGGELVTVFDAADGTKALPRMLRLHLPLTLSQNTRACHGPFNRGPIAMYFDDHPPPHYHVITNDDRACATAQNTIHFWKS
jgi:hypothetical protein